MQDRFKFRYYDEKSKKMYDVCFIDFDNPCVSVYLSKEELLHIGKKSFKWENLLQCTGLKDKNGVLIFEGDILERTNGLNKKIGVVKYDDNFLQFRASNMSLFSMTNRSIVIGNIYKNPELMELKND